MEREYVGLAIQLVGTAIAAGALLLEIRAKLSPSTAANHEQDEGQRSNPWAEPIQTRPRRVLSREREWERLRGPADFRPLGPDPDSVAVQEWAAEVLQEYLDRAATDWERQHKIDADLQRADLELRQEQVERLAEQQVATRHRVIMEMLGLVVVAVGTIIGTAP